MDRFGLLLCCVDGRYIAQSIVAARRKYQLNYVDVITEPGMDLVLSHQPYKHACLREESLLAHIYHRMEKLVKAHNVKQIIIVAHADCLGNPGCHMHHYVCLAEAKKRVQSWFPKIPVDRVYIEQDNVNFIH